MYEDRGIHSWPQETDGALCGGDCTLAQEAEVKINKSATPPNPFMNQTKQSSSTACLRH